MAHRDRTSKYKGEDYVASYGLEKWINQCLRCQERGYNPNMPSEVAQNKYGRGEYCAKVIRRMFKPLSLDSNGLCAMCSPDPG